MTIKKIIIFSFFLVLSYTLFIYWQGLTGDFIFDDYANLGVLEQLKYFSLETRLAYFVLISPGDIGRPVSLLSFLINDFAWPSNPWSFKYTNLLIHILIGVLIFWFIYRILYITKHNHNYTLLIAFFSMTLWLLHPLNISTTLYVIQRMAQLSALFTLAALISYTYFRQAVYQQPIKSYLKITFSLVFFGLLALLSKENGALLLFYILVLEFFFLQPKKLHLPIHYHKWAFFVLYLPILILLSYFIINFDKISAGYVIRDFSMLERVLTEFRVLFDYINQIFLPHISNRGLFHDDYVISKSLFNPLSTFFAFLGLVGLIIVAFLFRKKYIVLSFAILWFLVGHLLESLTFIPLEIYFEHRNYFPMIGLLFALSYLSVHYIGKLKLFLYFYIFILVLLFSFITYNNAKLWGDDVLLAYTWARENPSSVRSQQLASKYAAREGHWYLYEKFSKQAQEANPNDIGLMLYDLYIRCISNQLTPQEAFNTFRKLDKYIPTAIYSSILNASIEFLIKDIRSERCEVLDFSDIERLIYQVLKKSPLQKPSQKSTLYYYLSEIYIEKQNLNSTMIALEKAYELKPSLDLVVLQRDVLITAGLWEEALVFAKKAQEDLKKEHFLIQKTKAFKINNIASLLENNVKEMHEQEQQHNEN